MSSPNAEFEQIWTRGTSCTWKNPAPSNPRTQKGLEKHSTWKPYTQTSNLGGTKQQRDYHDKKADFQTQTARDSHNHYSDGVSATAQSVKSCWENCEDRKRQALHSNLTCDSGYDSVNSHCFQTSHLRLETWTLLCEMGKLTRTRVYVCARSHTVIHIVVCTSAAAANARVFARIRSER